MKRILILDNEPDIVRLIATIIAQNWTHFEITKENDWTEAVSIIEDVPPFDLVITDFRMPRGREGLSVVKAVRERSNATKIILMSSDITQPDMEEARPDKFLQKAFTVGSVVAAIKELIPDIEECPA